MTNMFPLQPTQHKITTNLCTFGVFFFVVVVKNKYILLFESYTNYVSMQQQKYLFVCKSATKFAIN